jgi:glycosyltransferase involved in cell wall biosynthesis
MVVAPSGNTGAVPGVRVVGAPSVSLPMYPEVRVALPHPAVVRQIDEFAADVVHLAGPVTNGLAGLCYAQARLRPLVSTFHTALPEYARLYGMPWMVEPAWRALRAIHNRCAVTLCPSRVTVEHLRERGFERVELWSRGVDADLFTPARRPRPPHPPRPDRPTPRRRAELATPG